MIANSAENHRLGTKGIDSSEHEKWIQCTFTAETKSLSPDLLPHILEAMLVEVVSLVTKNQRKPEMISLLAYDGSKYVGGKSRVIKDFAQRTFQVIAFEILNEIYPLLFTPANLRASNKILLRIKCHNQKPERAHLPRESLFRPLGIGDKLFVSDDESNKKPDLNHNEQGMRIRDFAIDNTKAANFGLIDSSVKDAATREPHYYYRPKPDLKLANQQKNRSRSNEKKRFNVRKSALEKIAEVKKYPLCGQRFIDTSSQDQVRSHLLECSKFQTKVSKENGQEDNKPPRDDFPNSGTESQKPSSYFTIKLGMVQAATVPPIASQEIEIKIPMAFYSIFPQP